MINIISRFNGSGLSKDMEILTSSISSPVRYVPFDAGDKAPKANINLFVELFDPRYLDCAKLNYIMPNQEWFYDSWKKYIPVFDLILCKTKLAYQNFSEAGGKCVFTSFTSQDKYLPIKKHPLIFHCSNRSKTKGTQAVIDAYNRFPDLPRLTLLSKRVKGSAPNIQKIDGFVQEKQFRIKQNQHQIHLCPSVSEGFGHYIVEAMSAKSVVITTDGPPMNEMITPETGFLIPVSESVPFRMGDNHYFHEVDLINTLFEAVRSSDLKAKGEAAREWYLENNRFFRQKIREVF